MATTKQVVMIKTAVSKLGLTDDEYRAILSSFEVISSKQLEDHQVHKIMKTFESMGFKVVKYKENDHKIKKYRNNRATKDQIDYILDLWDKSKNVRDKSAEGLRRFIKRLTRKDHIEWITDKDASLLIRRIQEL